MGATLRVQDKFWGSLGGREGRLPRTKGLPEPCKAVEPRLEAGERY